MAEDQARPMASTDAATPIVTDSPRSKAGLHAGRHNQTEVRSLIAQEMKNEIITCSLNTFMEHYLPSLPSDDEVDTYKTYLKERGVLMPNDKWRDFGTTTSSRTEHENAVFSKLKDISDALVACPSVGTATYRYVTCATRSTPSDKEGANHQEDGVFTWGFLPPGQEEVYVRNVAVIAEYKKSKSANEVQKNRQQIITDANHVMNDDPLRLFTFGITIEDNHVSIWYFSRSHSAKSEHFDLVEDPSNLIRVFASFIFASPSSIGFDDSVRRITSNGSKSHYIFRISDPGSSQERYFRTRNSLSDLRRLCITGRATRVWEAQEVSSFENSDPISKQIFVLRDVWLDSGAKTEREIQQEIFDDLTEFYAELAEEPNPPHFKHFNLELNKEVRAALAEDNYKKYFLTIVCEGRGPESKAAAPGFTVDFNLIAPLNQPKPTAPSKTKDTDKSRNNPSTLNQVDLDQHKEPEPPEVPREYRPKNRYTLVYEEYCKDLDNSDIISLHDVFSVLRDSLIALALLYCVDRVHRDISCGNVLLWKDSDGMVHGKLGDLEYVKHFTVAEGPPSADPKTGTAAFMPVEIVAREYSYFSDFSLKSSNASLPGLPLPTQDGPPSPEPPVRHNFQHDLESLLWLTLWILTTRMDYPRGLVDFRELFPNTARVGIRGGVFAGFFLDTIIKGLDPALTRDLKYSLSNTFVLMYHAYRCRNGKSKHNDISSYSTMYSLMYGFLHTPIPPDAPSLIARSKNPNDMKKRVRIASNMERSSKRRQLSREMHGTRLSSSSN